jgi:hypothetical protein
MSVHIDTNLSAVVAVPKAPTQRKQSYSLKVGEFDDSDKIMRDLLLRQHWRLAALNLRL